MENISKEVESNDIKIDKFFEVAKVIIYSIIGIVVFFIPVTIWSIGIELASSKLTGIKYNINPIKLNILNFNQFFSV